MKFVETEEPRHFKPVTFVIEKEEELLHLWHVLNQPQANVKDMYDKARTTSVAKPDAGYGVLDDMWGTVDDAVIACGLKKEDG